MIFCDTSLLLSLYVADRWSGEATRLVSSLTVPLVWTPWHELELSTAIEARVGRGWTSKAEAASVYAAVEKHRYEGFLYDVHPDSWAKVFVDGAEIAKSYGSGFLNRGMDVLHVALCLNLRLEKFWSMDGRQRKLAKALGLDVNPLG